MRALNTCDFDVPRRCRAASDLFVIEPFDVVQQNASGTLQAAVRRRAPDPAARSRFHAGRGPNAISLSRVEVSLFIFA